jgi:8-oxo-dGTP pyrophosphatase MutT (NUDIX family)
MPLPMTTRQRREGQRTDAARAQPRATIQAIESRAQAIRHRATISPRPARDACDARAELYLRSSPLITPDELSERLRARPAVRSAARGRAASVLVPIFATPDGPRVVLIKRTDSMRTHKGQYAFPGGGRDPGDASAVETALREAHEEIGLAPSDVRVLGLLDDLVTISDFVVTPVVAWIPSTHAFRPNGAEVALVLELPLRVFLDPPRARTLLREGLRRLVLAFDIEGHFIWGATASILRNLAAVIATATEVA